MNVNQNVFSTLIDMLSTYPSVDVILPTDERYAKARLIYNRMHDSYPALIIRTLNLDALRYTIAFSIKHKIEFAIRGGGHHIGGFGTCHGGIVLDFSSFKAIEIDKEKNIVSVQPGVCLGDIDKALSSKGYVVPTGTVSETGIAGLTLGGGIGWLIGRYGLTCDQLCGADVLLADGQVVKAEDPRHESLLWALRGGGGNFGLVLNFRYRLHPLPKTVCGMGWVLWSDVVEVMEKILHYLNARCPRSMTLAFLFLRDSQGELRLRIDFCCADGSPEDLRHLCELSPLIEWSEVGEIAFDLWQKKFDDAFLPPMRGYWKAAYLEAITSENIQSLCAAFEASSNSRASILIEHLHGAFKDYTQETSAFPLRKSNFGILFTSRWENEIDDDAQRHWVRSSFDKIDPHGNSSSYVNYTCADDQRAVHALVSDSHFKITSVKAHYDPNNVFKRNHNVVPEMKRRTSNVC